MKILILTLALFTTSSFANMNSPANTNATGTTGTSTSGSTTQPSTFNTDTIHSVVGKTGNGSNSKVKTRKNSTNQKSIREYERINNGTNTLPSTRPPGRNNSHPHMNSDQR